MELKIPLSIDSLKENKQLIFIIAVVLATAFIGKWHMEKHADPRPGFDYWLSFKGQGEYIFPVLLPHHNTEEKKHNRIKTALKKVNKELRLIGKELEIDAYLTFYVARHTLASELFWKKGASAGEVMSLLGHSDLATTQIYLEDLNPDEKGKVQRKVGFKNN